MATEYGAAGIFQIHARVASEKLVAGARVMARICQRTAALQRLEKLRQLVQLVGLVVGVSQAVQRLRRHANASTARTRVGSGGHNIHEPKDAYNRSLTAAEFLAENKYGKMIADPRTAEPGSKQHRMFVAQFRVPYAVFQDIVEDCRGSRWSGSTAGRGLGVGRPGVSLEAKVLSALYRLGTGCIARTQADLFGLRPSCAQQFFLDFCAHQSRNFKQESTAPDPESDAELTKIERVYAKMGFPGCLGSVDGVHVGWARCPSRLLPRHKGAKGYPSRSFNVTVDHRRFIQHVAASKPGTMNDKSSVRHDPFIVGVRAGLYRHFRFRVRGRTLTGGWLMSDGGYHRWRCLQCPRPHDSRRHIKAWSKALESVRKDVECTFGMMKGRFRILKLPFECQHEQHIDYVFYTCAYLHNRVLRYNGFDEVWQNDEDWTGQAGRFPSDLCGTRHVHAHGAPFSYNVQSDTDFSGMGSLDDEEDSELGGHEQWRQLGEELARHFYRELRSKRLKWPKSQRECAAKLRSFL